MYHALIINCFLVYLLVTFSFTRFKTFSHSLAFLKQYSTFLKNVIYDFKPLVRRSKCD